MATLPPASATPEALATPLEAATLPDTPATVAAPLDEATLPPASATPEAVAVPELDARAPERPVIVATPADPATRPVRTSDDATPCEKAMLLVSSRSERTSTDDVCDMHVAVPAVVAPAVASVPVMMARPPPLPVFTT